MKAQNLKCLPNKGLFSHEHLLSFQLPYCRKVIRKAKGTQTGTASTKIEFNDQFSIISQMQETLSQQEDHPVPLFMKETLPEEGTTIVLSPEKLLEEIAAVRHKIQVQPINLAYVFGHDSILDTLITILTTHETS